MQNVWLVILPPLLVFFLSFATHRIVLSLMVGILSATMIFHDFAPIAALKTAGIRLWDKTELGNLTSWDGFLKSDNVQIYLFLLLLGIIITVISKTGGAYAYGNFVQKRLKNKTSAETSSLLLSLCFFIDDYLNVLMVSSVMPPITDRFKIPRVKLAFFSNIFAAALCILVPFSSWGAFIMSQFDSSGISLDAGSLVASTPFAFFVHAIPFAFFSIIIIFAGFFIVKTKISFGLMKQHEDLAQTTGNLYGNKKQALTKAVHHENGSVFDFVFPIILLVSTIFVGLFLTPLTTFQSLLLGAALTLGISLPSFLLRKKLFIKDLCPTIKEGIMLMLPSLVVVTLAWTFGEVLSQDLQTGQYIASKLIGTITITLLPLLFFIVTTMVTLGIGSAWGTIGIMVPIALPLVIQLSHLATPVTIQSLPIIIPTISAVLAGTIAGINLSPIADIVVMASNSTGSHHMDHVKSQQMYMLPVCIGTAVSFLIAGFMVNYHFLLSALIALLAGVIVACGLLALGGLKRRSKSI